MRHVVIGLQVAGPVMPGVGQAATEGRVSAAPGT